MTASVCWISAVGMVLATGCGGEATGGEGHGDAEPSTPAPSVDGSATVGFGAGVNAGPSAPSNGAAGGGPQASPPSVVGGSDEAGTGPIGVNPSSSPPPPPPPSQAHIVTLAWGHTCPWGMAIDEANVYWTDCGDPSAGQVQKVPKAGGPVVPLASGNRLSGIAVDGANVYWVAGTADASSGAIMTVPIAGGTPTVVAPESGAPAHIAVDASYVYWGELNQGAVMRAPLGGGMPMTVASAVGPFQIALGDTAVFWMEPQGLMTAPKAGGMALALTRPSPTLPTDGLAVNATTVYFTGGPPDGQPGVSEVPVGGGPTAIVSEDPSLPGGGPIALDQARVYWADMSGSVYAAPLAGGPPILLATGQDNVDAIAVDDAAVYWLVNGNGSPGGVMELALSAIGLP